MTSLLNYIVWQPDLEAFHLGPITVRTDVDYWLGTRIPGSKKAV